MVQNDIIDPNNNVRVYKISHLELATKYQYLFGIINWIPMDRFFDTIIDVDYRYHAALTYKTGSTLVGISKLIT
jgi:hypothetical protein